MADAGPVRDGRALLTPLLATLVGEDGLDIELDVFHGERHYVYLSQVRMDGASWVRDVVNGVDGQAAATVTSAAANLLDLALDPAQGERLNASAPSSSWPPPRAEGEAPYTKRDKPFPGVTCTRYKKVNEKPLTALTTVATASARNGPTINTIYANGAKTVTSTGISFDGGLSFAINGARERTKTTGADFADQKAKRNKAIARQYLVGMEHEVLRRVCLGNEYDDYRVQYMTAPIGLTGASRLKKVAGPVWTCKQEHIAEATGADFVHTDDHKAATYTRAFSLRPLGGAAFEGNAQSGYSDQVRIEFHFANPMRGWWCGHNGFPAKNGQIVQAFER